MASEFPNQRSASMAGRTRRLLIEPKAEWPRIDAEPMTVGQVMTGWAAPLAAIGPVAGLIGGLVFGYGAFGIVYRPTITGAIGTALLSWALSLLGVWVTSLIIDALAPQFGGRRDRVAATKVAAFAMTAAWVAGIFQLVPALAFLGILGIYSLYLLYLGLPVLMKTPQDKAVPYAAVTIAAGVAIFLVVGAITGVLASRLFTPTIQSAAAAGGEVTVPGLGTVDLGKLEAASKEMEAASARAAAGASSPPTDVGTLEALLPASAGGWQRGDVETTSGAAAGVGGSRAEARYTQGDDTITLAITDMGAMGALAGIGQALNVNSERKSASGYDRTSTADGRMVNEKWDADARSGSYNVILGSRYSVSAEGRAPDAAAFRTLVEAVDLARLETMAKAAAQ